MPYQTKRLAALYLYPCLALLGFADDLRGQYKPKPEGLYLNAQGIAFNSYAGGPATQTLAVGVKTIPNALDFEVVSAEGPTLPSWISVSPAVTKSPATVSITVDFTQFQPGETRDVLLKFEVLDPRFRNNEFRLWREQLRVNAVYSFTQNPPAAWATPSVIELDGESDPPYTTDVEIENLGGGAFNYLLEPQYIDGAGWLFVSPTIGSVGSSPQTVTVSANAAGLAEGVYRGALTLSTDIPGGDPLTIPVTLNLAGTPNLSVLPASITRETRGGKAEAEPVLLAVSNAGGGQVGFRVEAGAEWVTVEPTQGVAGASSVDVEVSFRTIDLPPGVYGTELTITALDNEAVAPVSVPVQVRVRPGGTFSVMPSRIDARTAPESGRKMHRLIEITSPELDELIWTASVEPPSATWLRLKTSGGSLPAALQVEIDPRELRGPATVSANIALEFEYTQHAGGAAQAAESSVRVPVTVRFAAEEPEIEVSPAVAHLWTPAGSASPLRRPLLIEDSRPNPAPWTLAADPDAAGWLRVSPSFGSGPALAEFSADPTGLAPGVYQGRVIATIGGEERVVRVGLVVGQAGEQPLAAAHAGLELFGEAKVGVGGLGSSPPPWSFSVLEGGSWLTAEASTGELTVGASSKSEGPRYGLIQLDAPAASNGAQYLTVIDPGAAAPSGGPLVTPGGLLFVGGAEELAAQFLRITSVDEEEKAFQAGASTDSGGGWLSVSTTTNVIGAEESVDVAVSVNASGLAPGVYRGQAAIAPQGGPLRAASVTLVVVPANCVSSTTALAPVEPAIGFEGTAGRPVPVTAKIVDNCGDAAVGVGGAFAGLAASGALTTFADGSASGTWVPAEDAAEAALTLAGGGEIVVIPGAVRANPDPAALFAAPPVHGATFELGRALAPGAAATVFGVNLAAGQQEAASTPLPTRMQETDVLFGGFSAPLYFTSVGQVNFQAPAEAPAGALAQAVVRRGGAVSTPQTVLVAPAQPGLYSLHPDFDGPSRAVALNQDFTLNTSSNPASPGEYVTVFFTGIGELDLPLASGVAAPSAEPLARAALETQARIAGQQAQAAYVGLAPGFVGLGQANLLVPQDAAAGLAPVVLTIGGHASPPLTIAIE